MIKFLLKGILRDRSRSLLPIAIITLGVALTIFLSAYVGGMLGDVVNLAAKFNTGHVKIMTRAYTENAGQLPNDLALLDVGEMEQELRKTYPDMDWVQRIRFGGLVDVPDANGETRAQGPAAGQSYDFLSPNSKEAERLGLEKALQQGRAIQKAGEALISENFAQKLDVKLGEEVTLFGSTMDGAMTFKNFTVVGTVAFGSTALDNGAIIVDLADAQQALDMEDATAEMLGYFNHENYDHEKAATIASTFNAKYEADTDEFAPIMQTLKEQNDMGSMIDLSNSMQAILMGLFIFAMSIVLWNTGLIGGLRRYGEFGVRLAMGEEKGQIYRSLIMEAVLIGIIGSVLGTIVGLIPSYFLQEYGLDISEFTKGAQTGQMMMPSVIRANISPNAFYIGFIPGVFSMVLGTALAGIGIYRRQTAQLFKELEV